MSSRMSWRFHSDLSDDLRKVAVDWARSNGLDTDRVPFNAVFTIADGQLSTEYLAPGGAAHVDYTPVTVPLVVPLPEPFASSPGGQHAPRPPWRFDVPEVPAHVTALKDYEGEVFVRNPHDNAYWASWSRKPTRWMSTTQLMVLFPLVECPDPRAAS